MSLRSKLCSLAALFRTAIRFAESRTPAARSQFKGDHGEAICNWKLEFLPEGYFRFSNVLFPVPSNATVEIDHLVVSPHGIFVIESKAWSGLILGKPEDYFWTVCLGHRKIRAFSPLRQNQGHIAALVDVLGLSEKYFHSTVVLLSPDCRLSVGSEIDGRRADFGRGS